MKQTIIIVVIALVLLAVVAVQQRHRIIIGALSSGEVPALLAARDEGPNVTWFDDYFTVEQLDEQTFAIGETRYHQQNFNYLILGKQRAILFDAGPGVRDVRPVVESLTDLPLTFIPSHFHFDHIGNEITFSHVAVVDLPYLRDRAVDNNLELTWQEHVGSAEGFDLPTLEVGEWIAPGAFIDLGGRQLQLLYTPGHTEDSVSLLDISSGMVFSGDFLYPGPLIAFLPNSSLAAYLRASQDVLSVVDGNTRFLGAHRMAPPGAPRLGLRDLQDLESALVRIRAGEMAAEGVYPVVYEVNSAMQLWAEPAWLQDW